jgi:ring-1,2-phenylacetyl-CoA epoxidase subunit PaaD
MVIAELLEEVRDPEIPVLSITDLGIVRGIETEGDQVIVTVTPTYSGCPAMDTIRSDIARVLSTHGYRATVRTTYAPAWTTDDITPAGREKLAAVGIAPPGPPAAVLCPRCATPRPRTISLFGSTACKALLVCSACGEPFHYFKELR